MENKNLEEQKEIIELKHKYKMEEMAYERENYKIAHDLQLEVIRIKSAEIKRTQQRGDFERYSRP